MSSAAAGAEAVELLPGYYEEEATGAWLTLPPFPDEGVPTIGHYVLAWCEEWLTDHLSGEPWRWRPGQIRFVLWWYALQGPGPVGRWLYRSGCKRGAKGTGKDPLLAALALAELCGPTRPVWRHELGEWEGERHRMALVQIGANSEAQAADPLRVANAMVGSKMAREYVFDKGITRTQIEGGSRLELLTRSEASTEGDPATCILLNESHHMTHSSGGQRLAGVARRNVGKSPGGMGRLCEFTNAHQPGEGSVAEDTYEAWQAQVAGRTRRADILYDSREAPPHLQLADEEQLMEGLEAAYADSPWSDLERLRDEALDPRIPVADAIRYYFASLPTAADAWVEPRNFDKLARSEILEDGDDLAVFLDCSKSTDATVLAGCRIDDGHVVALGIWQRPRGDRGHGWLAPREEVDATVRAVLARYSVQWLGIDPSPALEDTSEALYWQEVLDGLHRDYRRELPLWATPGEAKGSAVSFDMRLSQRGGKDRVKAFTEEAELTAAAIDEEGSLTWDGSPELRLHVHNARRRPNPWGVSLGKVSRSSGRLVDYAVAMVGARLGRRLVLNSGKRRRRRSGKAVFV